MADLLIRTFEMRDYEQVAALWRAAGLTLHLSDDAQSIQQKLERDPELFIVGEVDGQVVGAVLGCYDGRRGWVNHLAVAPDQQRNGLGTMLMAELEARFLAIGCVKVNLPSSRITAASSVSTTASATSATNSYSWRRLSSKGC